VIGGVFLLSRSPEALADWYRRHLGWELAFLPDEGYYTELYFREDDDTEQRQHLVFAIMPGDPGNGEGHIINYRVEDIEAVRPGVRTDRGRRPSSDRHRPTPVANALTALTDQHHRSWTHYRASDCTFEPPNSGDIPERWLTRRY
jgi:hypothetical protein